MVREGVEKEQRRSREGAEKEKRRSREGEEKEKRRSREGAEKELEEQRSSRGGAERAEKVEKDKRRGQMFSQVLAPSLGAMFRLNATPHSAHTSSCLVPPLILYFLAAVWCCAELADAQMPFLDIHWLAANLSVAAVAASGPSRFRFFALCNSARNLRFSSCSASKRCC